MPVDAVGEGPGKCHFPGCDPKAVLASAALGIVVDEAKRVIAKLQPEAPVEITSAHALNGSSPSTSVGR
jgi:hypothetical protein